MYSVMPILTEVIESQCKVSAVTNVGKELELFDRRPANDKNKLSTLEWYSGFSVSNDSFNKLIADIEFPEGSTPS